MSEFEERNREMISRMGRDEPLRELTKEWFRAASRHEYSYHFRWMGRPIIQFPADVVALQELIWRVQPAIVVETGIARGGSLIFHASMLELLGGDRRVIGIDVDIRPHNRQEIEAHPMFRRITMIQGSSIDPAVVRQVHELASGRGPVLVILDSNHTHDHVLAELRAYAPLVRRDSYLVVLDTVVEYLPDELCAGRPWRRGNNPWTAVQAFLQESDRFEIDQEMNGKLLISVAPDGYLRCVKD